MSLLSAQDLVAQFGAHVSLGNKETRSEVLPFGWGELDLILPDGGLPRGVVELRSPHGLGGTTSIALAAIRAVQAHDKEAWGGWIDPAGALFAPGVVMADVDTNRLLVVRPPRERLLRVSMALARSSAFGVLVIDMDSNDAPAKDTDSAAKAGRSRTSHLSKLEPFVRKLAMLAGESGSTVLLLTDATLARAAPLPVAMRIEVRRSLNALTLRVAKERHGRIGNTQSFSFDTHPRLSFTV